MSASPPDSLWHLTETYKGLITISVEALKMLAIVNGGAAVAVLTYVGNLVSHGSARAAPPDMTPALYGFCGGLLATTLAFIVAYVTQLRLYGEERGRRAGEAVRQYHVWGVSAGVILAFLAAVAFGFGCLLAAHALGAAHP